MIKVTSMKIKRLFLSVIMLISCLCFVSCGKKGDGDNLDMPSVGNDKQESTVSVDIDRRLTRYAGDELKKIELFLIGEHTDGEVAWVDEDYVLVVGDNTCSWVFTPSDTSKYKSKTGSLTITAERNLAEPEVSEVEIVFNQTVYDNAINEIYKDAKLSTVGLRCSSNVPEGYTIEWLNPNETFSTDVTSYNWLFKPNNSNFKEKTGTITINSSRMKNQELFKIEVDSNTKASGYKAFDSFDCSGLTIKECYNAGKVIPVSNIADSCTVTYQTDECLHQGDTEVSITYKNKSCTAKIEAVGYYIIPKPSQIDELVYDGSKKELRVQSSSYYSVTQRSEIEAGSYDVTLTIDENYQNDCRWSEDSESFTTTVECKILKADLYVMANGYDGSYDGEMHYLTLSGNGIEKGYYSITELNESNYQDTSIASETPIGFKDSGTHKVYYFAIGDKNHNNLASYGLIKINPIIPTMTLRPCYSLYTGSSVNYPSNNVVVTGTDNTILANGTLGIEYYSHYDGMNLSGKLSGAPTNVGNVYVLVKYAGDGENYGEVQGVTNLYIDNVNNGLYAQTGESKFAFKDDSYTVTSGNYSISGSKQECDSYVEFNALPKVNGIIEVEFSCKFLEGNENIKNGKLIYDDGYVLLCEDGSTYDIDLNEDKDELVVGTDIILNKWVLPDYLGTYTAQTVEDEDYNEEKNNGTKNTEIEIYNDHGTIRFIARVNLKYSENTSPNLTAGGYAEWQGVVECGFVNAEAGDFSYALYLYVTDLDDGYRGSETKYFKLIWSVNSSNRYTITDDERYIEGANYTSIVETTTTNDSGTVTTTKIDYTKKNED